MLHSPINKRFTLLLFSLLLGLNLWAQDRPVVPIMNYAASELEFHPQNWSVVTDQQGLVYVANGEAILEFDGSEWREIKAANLSGFLSVGIDTAGRIYAGGISEIGYLEATENGRPEFVSLTDQLPDSLADFTHVWNTHCVGDRVYFMTTGVTFVFRANSFETAYFPRSTYVWAYQVEDKYYLLDDDAGLFTPGPQGLVRIPQSTWVSDVNSYAMVEYDQDTWLVTTGGDGLFLYQPFANDSTVIPFATNIDSLFGKVRYYAAAALPNGRFALGTYANGVFVVDAQGRLLERYSSQEGLLSESINSLHWDERSGLLWASLNSGVSSIAIDAPIRAMPEGEHYLGAANDLAFSGQGVYVATNQGVWFHQSPDWTKTTESKWERIPEVQALTFRLLVVGDEVLAGTNQGIFLINGVSAKLISDHYSRELLPIRGLEDHVVSFGRQDMEVLQKVNGAWTQKLLVENLDDEFLSGRQDLSAEGLVFWAGHFTEGVTRLELDPMITKAEVSVFDSTDGLNDRWVQVFTLQDQVHFGNDGLGLLVFDDASGRFVSSPLFPGLESTGVFVAAADGGMNAWTDVDGLIWHWEKSGTGHQYQPDSMFYNQLDIGDVNAILPKTAHGEVWMAGMGGLSRSALQKISSAKPRPVLIRKVTAGFDSVLVDGSASSFNSTIELSYGLRNLNFRYSAPAGAEGEVQYSTRLDGLQEDWSAWSGNTKARYLKLPSGDYTFSVKSRTKDGVESEPVSFSFRVRAPWYYKWWAIVIYVLVFGLIVIVARRLIEARKVRQHNEQLEAEVAARTEEIRHQRDELADQKAIIEEKNKGIMDSIRYAQRIQKAILPPDAKVQSLFPKSFVLYLPKDIVSGDFYWVEEAPNGFALFAAVDCTGHGVPGAFMSIVGYNLLQQAVKEKGAWRPEDLLDNLNQGVRKALRQTSEEMTVKDGMDIAACAWDKETGAVHFSGAKNPIYLIRKKGSTPLPEEKDELNEWAERHQLDPTRVRMAQSETHFLLEVKGDRHPIGAYVGETLKPFQSFTLQTQPGDMVYLFSDGFADQFGEKTGKKFMYGNFKKLLLEIQNQSPDAQREALETAFNNWRGNHKQVDDVCVIGFRV